MSITLIARRVLTAAATLALVAAAPGLTGSASASDHHDSFDSSWTCSSEITPLTAEQQAAVDLAVAAYDKAALDARMALKTSLSGLRTAVMNDPAVVAARTTAAAAHDAKEAAEDTAGEDAADLAYDTAKKAYHDALKAAMVKYSADAKTAVTLYRSTVSSAETTYVAALTIVFGSTGGIPHELLSPSDHHDDDHDDDCDDDMDDDDDD